MKALRPLLSVGLIIGLIFALRASGAGQFFDLTAMRSVFTDHGAWSIAIFIGLFALGNLAFIPNWIFLLAAVLALGRWQGGLLTYAAAMVSCAVTFLVGRLLGGQAFTQLDSPLAIRILAKLNQQPIRAVVVLRTLFQTLAGLNYTLAFSNIGFKQYMVGTALGLPLPIALYCLLFDVLLRWLG